MARLILDNRSDLPWNTFLQIAEDVIANGRISNNGKQYSYLTIFRFPISASEMEEYHVVSDLNEKSDKLTLYKPDLNGQ